MTYTAPKLICSSTHIPFKISVVSKEPVLWIGEVESIALHVQESPPANIKHPPQWQVFNITEVAGFNIRGRDYI